MNKGKIKQEPWENQQTEEHGYVSAGYNPETHKISLTLNRVFKADPQVEVTEEILNKYVEEGIKALSGS